MRLKQAKKLSKECSAFRVDDSGYICLARKHWKNMLVLAPLDHAQFGFINAGELSNTAIAHMWDDWIPLNRNTPSYIPDKQHFKFYIAQKEIYDKKVLNGKM